MWVRIIDAVVHRWYRQSGPRRTYLYINEDVGSSSSSAVVAVAVAVAAVGLGLG